ncbi:MAG: hypothetical protein ACP5R5_00380 [Armatimonadota bacterium]
MYRRTASIILAVVALAVAIGSASFGQAAIPDAYVKGSGAIQVGTNLGLFEINVVRTGAILNGGFRYTEVASNATRPVAVIVSRVVKSLVVNGNFATITAEGIWNGVPSNLTVECLDDNPSGDWFHITAVPISSPMPVIYDAAGGVIKGDIAVFSRPAAAGYTKGYGTIATANNCIGKFRFWAELTSAGVRGCLNYVDYNPAALSAIVRPRAVIYLPRVERLIIVGNTAVFGGKGALNGRPALIEVKVVDNASPSGPAVRDAFFIKATPLTADSVTAGYEAGGPLTSGDIVVAPINGG